MLDCTIIVLLVLEIEDSKVEVGLEVLRVDQDGALVQSENLCDDGRVAIPSGAHALCQTVDGVNVLSVQLQYLFVDFQLDTTNTCSVS